MESIKQGTIRTVAFFNYIVVICNYSAAIEFRFYANNNIGFYCDLARSVVVKMQMVVVMDIFRVCHLLDDAFRKIFFTNLVHNFLVW